MAKQGKNYRFKTETPKRQITYKTRHKKTNDNKNRQLATYSCLQIRSLTILRGKLIPEP